VGLLTDVRDAVARYDEAVNRLLNLIIIRRTFETKEAVISSKIEGTQATFEEVLESDADELETGENEKQRDYREIANYRQAIDYGKVSTSRNVEPLSIRSSTIKQLVSGLSRSGRESCLASAMPIGTPPRGMAYIPLYTFFDAIICVLSSEQSFKKSAYEMIILDSVIIIKL
jgi:Fic/DOC family N-terminal